MIDDLITKLGIKLTHTDEEHIRISDTRKARGAFRWDYQKHRGEILLAKSAIERTKLHEIGHAINFILGNGQKYSDKVGIDSEKFADIVADILEVCYSGENDKMQLCDTQSTRCMLRRDSGKTQGCTPSTE